MTNRAIFCCCCENDVHARLTDGREIYPHRHDLYSLPFWRCDGCGNHVGCHHKTKDRTRPLGVIPTRHANQRYGGNVSPGCSRQCVDVVSFTA